MASVSANTESETSVSNTDTIVGQVKWFSNNLNYGFITVITEGEHNGIDVFVHQTNICPQVSNYRTLSAGEYVSFILTHNEGDKHPYQATNITGYSGGKLMCDFYQHKTQRGDGEGNRSFRDERSGRDNSNSRVHRSQSKQ